jgi:hypothetical protein
VVRLRERGDLDNADAATLLAGARQATLRVRRDVGRPAAQPPAAPEPGAERPVKPEQPAKPGKRGKPGRDREKDEDGDDE